MNAVVDFPDGRYAVIEGLQTETGHEQIVIAYPNEKTLRAAFAETSIVALDFATREEATAAGAASFPDPYQRRTEANTSSGMYRPAPRLDWTREPRTKRCSMLRGLGGFLVNLCAGVFASAFVMFASSNRASTVIRMVLGSSV